jgi:hypothetical protein
MKATPAQPAEHNGSEQSGFTKLLVKYEVGDRKLNIPLSWRDKWKNNLEKTKHISMRSRPLIPLK